MRRLLWTAALLLVASSVWAQSLAEVARKEKERRKKVEASETHTYTEADLRYKEGPMTQVSGQSTEASGDDSSGAEATATEGGAEPGAAEEPAEEEDPTRTEAYWRGRLDPLNARIRDIEARLQRPEFNENARGGAARQALERQLQQARSARDAILEEGRRAGVPPGWLR